MSRSNGEAGRHGVRREKARLVVICRDPLDCDRIREWLSASATVEVVADALSIPEAVGAIGRHSPDLLLIDLRSVTAGTVRRLAYSSARPMIIFLNSSGDPCDWDGVQRAATVTLQDRKLFCRQIELTAELRLAARPPVSDARLLELLTNRSFRRKPRVSGLLNNVLDPGQILWLEGNDSGTTVYGNQVRVVQRPMAMILDDFRRLGAKFALVSATIAINLDRTEAMHVERGGDGTVMLADGFRLGVDRERLRSILRKLRRAGSYSPTRMATAAPETARDELSHL